MPPTTRRFFTRSTTLPPAIQSRCEKSGLGLDETQARRNSPLLNLPARASTLIAAYGADELPELKRQSREFGAAWSAHGLPGEIIEVPRCHHYAVLEQLAQPDGILAKALAAAAGAEPR